MDGLPPPPGNPHTFGAHPTGPAAAQASQRPVGRPSTDPERDEQRLSERNALSKFINNLPKSATDYRVAIYKLKGSRGTRHDPRPIAMALLSDLEAAQQDNSMEPEAFIADLLMQKFGDRPMRVLCVPQDAHGKRVQKIAQWEMAVNMDDDLDDEDDEYEEFEDAPPGFDPRFANAAPMHPFPGGPFAQAPPPAPPAGNEHNVFREARGMLESQRQAEQSGTAVMMTMMQQMAAQQQQAQQMSMQMMVQQQQEQARREEERRRDEDRRREEERRRDEEHRAEQRREEDRRSESRTSLLATLLPAAMPLFQRMMEGKDDKITPILLTKLMGEDNNRTGMHDMFQLMAESSKQQVVMQSEMARNNMQQQTESSKLLMSHVLQMAQESVQAQRKLEVSREEGGGGPMETFAQVIQTMAPLLSSLAPAQPSPTMTQPQAQSAALPPPVQQPQQQYRPHPPQAPAQTQPAAAAHSGPPTRATHPHYTDAQWVEGGLKSLKQLHQGQLPPEQRPEALRWMATVLPPSLLTAVVNNDQQGVMESAGEVVMANSELMQWLSDGAAQQYLNDALQEMGDMMRNVPAAQPEAPVSKRPSKIRPPPLEDTEKEAILETEVVDYPESKGPLVETPQNEPTEAETVTVSQEGAGDGEITE